MFIASPLPVLMLRMAVAAYRPTLISRAMNVTKPTFGIRPPRIGEGFRASTARGATDSLQYGQVRSLVVIKARHCGHIRRLSIESILTGVDSECPACIT